jgi:hypothetical protein
MQRFCAGSTSRARLILAFLLSVLDGKILRDCIVMVDADQKNERGLLYYQKLSGDLFHASPRNYVAACHYG